MSEHPWIPLYVGDFVSDTAHLNDAETGQYLLILMYLWKNDGVLPDDPVKLARMAKCRRVSDDVMAFFKRKNNTITQKRLTEEIKKAREKSDKARASANARWLKNNDMGHADADANAMLSQSQSQSHSRRVTGESSDTTSEFREQFWPMYPNKVGKPYALKCFLAARKRAPLAAILGGLKLYIETKPPDRQWCNPSTWLNQDRWEDRPAPVAAKMSRTQEAIGNVLRRAANGMESGSSVGSVLRGEARSELPAISSGAGSLHGSSDRALHREAGKAVGANGHARGNTR